MLTKLSPWLMLTRVLEVSCQSFRPCLSRTLNLWDNAVPFRLSLKTLFPWISRGCSVVGEEETPEACINLMRFLLPLICLRLLFFQTISFQSLKVSADVEGNEMFQRLFFGFSSVVSALFFWPPAVRTSQLNWNKWSCQLAVLVVGPVFLNLFVCHVFCIMFWTRLSIGSAFPLCQCVRKIRLCKLLWRLSLSETRICAVF